MFLWFCVFLFLCFSVLFLRFCVFCVFVLLCLCVCAFVCLYVCAFVCLYFCAFVLVYFCMLVWLCGCVVVWLCWNMGTNLFCKSILVGEPSPKQGKRVLNVYAQNNKHIQPGAYVRRVAPPRPRRWLASPRGVGGLGK